MNTIIELDELQKIELSILTEFAEFCDSNKLRYYLAYGTLIGAVRHKGFIPWDDDIDVVMPRPDYNYLCSNFNRNLRSGSNIELIDPLLKTSIHTYVKIVDIRTEKIEAGIEYNNKKMLGVDIDVFPLDGWPLNKKRVLSKHKVNKALFMGIAISNLSTKNKVFPKVVVIKCLKLIRGLLVKILNKYAQKIDYDDSDWVGLQVCSYSDKPECYSKEIFKNKNKMYFEGIEFWIPSAYDTLLEFLYGNYMQLPPEDQRITHHSNICRWKKSKIG